MKRLVPRRGALVLLLVGLAPLTPGCVNKPLKSAFKPKGSPPPLPKGVEGKGISVNWMENLPNGEVRHVLDIEAASGTATTGTRSGTFNRSKGFFYQKGKKVLKFEAPRVAAAEKNQVVVATGRVKAWSIDPPGVTVEADRVTWKIPQNRIIAEGSVMLDFRSPDNSRPPMSGGPLPRLTIDTGMKSFSIP